MTKYKSGFVEIGLILAAIVVGSGVTVVASDSARPGDMLYGVDRGVENLRLAMSYSDQGEAKLNAQLASERLEEWQSLVDEEADPELVAEAQQRYEDHVSEALAKAENARKAGEDVTDTMTIIAENSIRQQATLEEVADKAPEAAQAGLERAQEASSRGLDQARQSLEDKQVQDIWDDVRVDKPGLDKMVPPPRYKTGNNQPTESIPEDGLSTPQQSNDN